METGVPYFPKSSFLQSAARFAKVLYLAKYYVEQNRRAPALYLSQALARRWL